MNVPHFKGYQPDGPVGMALTWLRSALACPAFEWESDQKELATKSLEDAEAWMKELFTNNFATVAAPAEGQPDNIIGDNKV